MGETNISWTDKVWNPTIGCSRVSRGCEKCYAETFAHRLEGMGQARYKGLSVVGKHGARWTGEVRQVPEVLAAPLRWRKPQRIFVNSMSDLFHDQVPFEYVAAVFGVMAACPQHTFQILTKRPARALEFFEWIGAGSGPWLRANFAKVRDLFASGSRFATYRGVRHRSGDDAGAMVLNAAGVQSWPLHNVHLGVSCEDQATADERIPKILKCPAAVWWVSAEPLLGPVRVDDITDGADGVLKPLVGLHWAPGRTSAGAPGMILQGGKGPAISWLVAGGESGGGHRPCDPVWIDSIVAQCSEAGVPVFVKQDSGPKPGKQGRLSAETWARKEFPGVRVPVAPKLGTDGGGA